MTKITHKTHKNHTKIPKDVFKDIPKEVQNGCPPVSSSAGAAMDQARDDDCTPLYVACHQGHSEVVYALLAAGAAVDTQLHHGHGYTALCSACERGHLACVKLLSSYGASRFVGPAPVTIAGRGGHDDVCAWLMLSHDVTLRLDLKTVLAHCCPAFHCFHPWLHCLLILGPSPTVAVELAAPPPRDHQCRSGARPAARWRRSGSCNARKRSHTAQPGTGARWGRQGDG
jgi:ankyrin repeat protein